MNVQKKIPPQVIRLSIIGLIIIIFIVYSIVIHESLQNKLNSIFSGMPAGLVTYKDASINPFTLAVTLKNVKINTNRQRPVSIHEVEINSIDTKHKTPRYMNIEVEGLALNLQSLSQTNPLFVNMLKTLGYSKLTSKIKINYKFNTRDKELDVKEMSLDLKHAGKIKYKVKFFNVDSLVGLMMQMRLAPQTIKIGELSVKYKDKSLANRIFKLLANRMHESVDSYKNSLISKLKANLQILKQTNQKFNEKLTKAFIGFIKEPDELEISISPNKPISIYELRDSNNSTQLLKQLNFKVSDD